MIKHVFVLIVQKIFIYLLFTKLKISLHERLYTKLLYTKTHFSKHSLFFIYLFNFLSKL